MSESGHRTGGRTGWGWLGRSGFSVVELLVLVAVCAILALVFMPSLAKTRPRADRIVCVNNLKQVALANRIFSVDNGDQFPYAAQSNQVNLATLTAAAYYAWITNELTTPKILVCPTDVTRRGPFLPEPLPRPQRQLSPHSGISFV